MESEPQDVVVHSRRRTAISTLLLAIMLVVSGLLLWHQDNNSPAADPPLGSTSADQVSISLYDPATRLRADKVVSTFENSTVDIQYGYAEDIKDGRGITAGRAGFTSSTGDLLEVVQRYCQQVPNSPLAAYLPALEAVNGSGSTKGLEGFTQSWATAATTDPHLRTVQDQVVDETYFIPAMKQADDVGIHTALGQLIIYDTIIQQGDGTDPDSLPAIVEETINKEGLATGHEAEWLKRFLEIRQRHLQRANDPATRKDWRESMPRVATLQSILRSGNFDLRPPLRLTVYGDQFRIN
jgi:chitosanase